MIIFYRIDSSSQSSSDADPGSDSSVGSYYCFVPSSFNQRAYCYEGNLNQAECDQLSIFADFGPESCPGLSNDGKSILERCPTDSGITIVFYRSDDSSLDSFLTCN